MRERLREVLPHYLAMFMLIWLVLGIVRRNVGQLDFWVEILVLALVCLAYMLLVQALGIAPSHWQGGFGDQPPEE
jgi:uncharacterized membrane protein